MSSVFSDEIQIFGARHAQQVGQVNPHATLTTPDAKIEITQPTGGIQAFKLGLFFKAFFENELSLKPVPGKVALYVSSYERARQTVAPTLRHSSLVVHYEDYLVEQNHRDSAGVHSPDEMDKILQSRARMADEADRNGTRHLLRYTPQGENQEDVANRARRLIPDMQKDYARGARIFIHIDHQVVERVLATIFTGRDISETKKEKQPGNCDLRLMTTSADSGIFVDHGYVYAGGKIQSPGVSPYTDQPDSDGPWVYRRNNPLIFRPGSVVPIQTETPEH